jgi:hypothetical protein
MQEPPGKGIRRNRLRVDITHVYLRCCWPIIALLLLLTKGESFLKSMERFAVRGNMVQSEIRRRGGMMQLVRICGWPAGSTLQGQYTCPEMGNIMDHSFDHVENPCL